MVKQRRNRAKVLIQDALQQLKEQIRQHELEENAASKYSLEKLGELTGLDPETVKKVLDRQGADRRSLDRCFTTFGLTLTDKDYIAAIQIDPVQIDPNFLGRDEAVTHLRELMNRNAKVIAIQARGGIGKTTLARRFLNQEFDLVLEFPIAKETKDIASIESLLEEKLRQLGEEPGQEFIVSCDRLKRKLQSNRIGILIDNLEPALDSTGRFIEPHRRYVEVLRILVDPSVLSTTLITTRERLREPSITVQTYLLKSLDVEAWKQFFQSQNLKTDIPAFAALHNAYGGNAKAMEIISGSIIEDFNGDVEAYWRLNQEDLFIERDLEYLVKQQFDRLQCLNPDAYKLICRMGCYRYQDVPTVPIEGILYLLWDISEKDSRRTVRDLQDRSLVDLENGCYRLHPVIREEALIRLRESQDIKVSNQKAAEFWSESTIRIDTIEDATNALESYYHYLEINDFENMFKVLKTRRENKIFKKRETLHLSCYRLGIIQQIITIVFDLIAISNSDYHSSALYNILGNLFWIRGFPNKGIEFHSISNRFAQKSLNESSNLDLECQRHLVLLPVFALGNIGVCKISLWELEGAINAFDESIQLLQKLGKKKSEMYFTRSRLGLMFARFNLKNEEPLLEELETINEKIDLERTIPWDSCNCLLFLSLIYKMKGKIDKAFSACEKLILISKKTSYTQLEAVGFRVLGELFREDEKYEQAIEKHLIALDMLDSVGAQCDLAEAHYQIGLTYQKMNKTNESNMAFQEAIRVFKLAQAPKQIDRVKESMHSLS